MYVLLKKKFLSTIKLSFEILQTKFFLTEHVAPILAPCHHPPKKWPFFWRGRGLYSRSVPSDIFSILEIRPWFKIWKMKVVISKSGLYVREPKNINLSRTRIDMKKSKLGFCRMSSGLSFHVKSLVNTCWPRMWKFGQKLKKPLKNAFFRPCGQNDGAFRQYGFCEYDIFFKIQWTLSYY